MSDETSNEDYLDLELLDFNGAGVHSYLRLGAEDASVAHGADLASQIATFVDDSRVRGGKDGATPDTTASKNIFRTLSQSERAAETATLRTKGGWRDHTDGNRVTTTRGDKVEVIRGNYKLLVLGREQWNDNAGVGLHYESSGGITYHFDEVPGQIVDVRWEYDDAVNTWRVIEECDTGHNVTRYHGVCKDWVQGGDFVTRVGSLAAYDNAISNTVPTAGDLDDFVTDTHFDKPTDASHQASFSWPSDDTLPNVRTEVFATSVEESAIAHSMESHIGSSRRYLEKLHDDTFTVGLFETNYYKTCDASMIGGEAYEYWFGPLYLELFLGMNSTMKGTLFFDARIGKVVVEANLGMISEINAAPARVALAFSTTNFVDFVAAPFITEYWAGLVLKTNPLAWELETTITRKDLSLSMIFS